MKMIVSSKTNIGKSGQHMQRMKLDPTLIYQINSK